MTMWMIWHSTGEQVTNFDDDVDDLALNVDHVFEADQCDAFDSDVDEGPTTQTMFMSNLTSEEAGVSYDSNIPSEVQDQDVGLDELEEGGKGVVSNIREFGGDRGGEEDERGFIVIGEVGG
ncbi:hypothetical protein Tco_0120584, partial [Tanacetum coccineum]